MPKYFVMKCQSPKNADHLFLDVGPDPLDKRWVAGRVFSPDAKKESFQPPAEPIEVTTQIEPGSVPRSYPELTWSPIPLMSRRVVEAIRSCGVDNIQTFATKLVPPFGVDPPPPEDFYLAVNIIGSVAAADLKQTEFDASVPDRMVSADIHSLAIDADKARSLLLFRLAENVSAVIAHERVRAGVEAAGIKTLSWLAPEQFAG